MTIRACSWWLLFVVLCSGCGGSTATTDAEPFDAPLDVAVDGAPDAAVDAPSSLSIDPPVWDLGVILVGATPGGGALLATPPPTQQFTITNAGGTATGTLAAAALTGAGAGRFQITTDGCAGISLSPGAACAVEVVLADRTEGQWTASLAVASPAGLARASLAVSIVRPAQLAIEAITTNNFGATQLGTTGTTLQFRVFNAGGQPTGPIDIELAGGSTSEFVIAFDGCTGTSLDAGGECPVRVRHMPTLRGEQGADLQASATPGGSVSLGLVGVGAAPAELYSATTAIDFGLVEVGVPSAPISVEIANVGDEVSGQLQISSSSSEVGVSSSCATLASGATCTFAISFVASAGGARSGSVTVLGMPGGSLTFPVTARGG